MCKKCSHFRLMLAVEKMKIAQPEMCEKYFVYYKENFERPPRGNTLKLTRVLWKSTQTSIICCCLFERRILFTRSIDRLLVFLIVYPIILTHFKNLRTSHDMFILLHVYFNFRCELFLTIEVKPQWLS